MDPFEELSRFIILCVIFTGPAAWLMAVWLKRRFGRCYDGTEEASSEEILRELKHEFPPCRRTVIRTQAEYLPFLFECIRENIDGGFEDPHMISLLDRVEIHKPDQERSATFTIVSGGERSGLHLRWKRDSWNRIEMRIQGAPKIIKALREYKRRIPKAAPQFC